jgi:lipoyl(octanoyl) transferase
VTTAPSAAPEVARRTLHGIWLGRRAYEPVVALQERLHAARRDGRIGDTVLLLEHEPVITLGRGAAPGNVLASPESLAARGVELVKSARGGDVTLHVPGQLVVYPIVDLSPDRRDVRRWVNQLTETMRRLVEELGVAAGRHEKHVGLWADGDEPRRFTNASEASNPVKIGAIGVRISHWVTMHGFALNLAPDLSLYAAIVPCGIREHGVSSVEALIGSAPSPRAVATRAFELLAEVIGNTPLSPVLSEGEAALTF